MTSTATLQAALDVMKNSDPSIGYSIAYPFGVIGPILCIYFMTRKVKPTFPPKAQRFHMGEITLSGDAAGRTLERSVEGAAGRRAGHDGPARTTTSCRWMTSCCRPATRLLVVADTEEGLSQAAAKFGQLEPGRLVKDRSALDYIRVFVGKASMVGVPLSKLALPAGTQLLHVRRYDVDIVPTPDLMLEFGDRVGVLMPPERKQEVRKHFRRHREGDRRIQLCLARHRHGARRSARPDPDPDPRRRHGHARHRRRPADRRADPRQAAPHRSDALDHAAAGQYRAAQFRPRDLPGRGRHQCRASPSCARSPSPA